MTIKHHISDDLILAYATGELDEATSLLIATHMALCPQCRRGLACAEAVGGTLIEAERETAVADGALETLLGRLDGAETPVAPPPARRGEVVLPQPLRDYAGGDVDSLPWRGLGGGVRHLPIATHGSRAKARLLYIPASAKVPDHGHRGLELTLVLAGSFYDEGAWFRRGDVDEADATVQHQPVAGPEEACICLAVTDAPLRFRGIVPRLAQPFLGI
jgi:putative transcriptional regulator